MENFDGDRRRLAMCSLGTLFRPAIGPPPTYLESGDQLRRHGWREGSPTPTYKHRSIGCSSYVTHGRAPRIAFRRALLSGRRVHATARRNPSVVHVTLSRRCRGLFAPPLAPRDSTHNAASRSSPGMRATGAARGSCPRSETVKTLVSLEFFPFFPPDCLISSLGDGLPRHLALESHLHGCRARCAGVRETRASACRVGAGLRARISMLDRC